MPPRHADIRARRLCRSASSILVCTALLISACGSDGPGIEPAGDGGPGTGEPGGVEVANARFDGDFPVLALTVSGEEFGLMSVPVVSIDTEFGGLTVMPGCNTYFGSFSLEEDGSASFTVTGGSGDSCTELEPQEEAVIDALGAATEWTEVDGGFRFDGPDQTSLLVGR